LPVSEKGFRFLKIRQKRWARPVLGCVCFRELDIEMFKAKGLGVGQDRVKLVLGDPAIQVRVPVVKNRMIL
jgi:hypothetical protein